MTVCRLKLRFKCSLRCHLGRYSTKQFGLRAIVQVAFCSVISSVKLNTRNIIDPDDATVFPSPDDDFLELRGLRKTP